MKINDFTVLHLKKVNFILILGISVFHDATVLSIHHTDKHIHHFSIEPMLF